MLATAGLLALLATPGSHADAPAVEPPPAAVLREAREIVDGMKKNERGPYKWIRWYCKDGTVHPAQPYPCESHGGSGWQHAEYSDARQRLAALGWRVGTIFTGMPWEEFWDGDQRNQRLRELPIESWLVGADDGWVLRKALYYRGRIQVEDEQEAGQALLVRLLSDPSWTAKNFLLARELVRTVPHPGLADELRDARTLSKTLADRDKTFEDLRVKIHNMPGRGDPAAVEAWIERARVRGAKPEVLDMAHRLVTQLQALYGNEGRAQRFAEARRAFHRNRLGPELDRLLEGVLEAPEAERVQRLAALMKLVRDQVASAPAGDADVALMDLSLDAEQALVPAAFHVVQDPSASRAQLLALARALADAAYGGGFISARERDALDAPVDALAAGAVAPTGSYLEAARALDRSGGWALTALRFAFAEPLVRYGALEPMTAGFTDDVLRESAMLPLAAVAGRVRRDAELRSGLVHDVFGEARAGLSGLNAGVAVGRLRVVTDAELDRGIKLQSDEIVVLPKTVAELDPVAGILTLSAGSALSHVQMLARNLGIPNVAVPPELAASIGRHVGERVLLAVSSQRSVVLEAWSALPPDARAAFEDASAKEVAPLVVPPPDLSVRRPLRLAELDASLSGKVVGPKAANVGQLARDFPGKVAPAVALPFGVYAAVAESAPDSPGVRLRAAFAQWRAGKLDEAGLAAEIEAVRQLVRGLSLPDDVRQQLRPLMDEAFGPAGSYGVFVRSDTNVEDLPGFTGAGLNQTIPNVVGLDAQLAAVPQVWSSPFVPRAVAWRRRALANPEEVYPSVLLMKSVPSDKSGVLATADVVTRGDGLTVSTAWGVGGAVDSEVAETLVLRDDGGVTLVSEAEAPYRRHLAPAGGVEWLPADSGAVLTADEQLALRTFARELAERREPARDAAGVALPWDVEFAFVGGELQLLQVRPLKERSAGRADRLVALVAPPPGAAEPSVALGDRAAPLPASDTPPANATPHPATAGGGLGR